MPQPGDQASDFDDDTPMDYDPAEDYIGAAGTAPPQLRVVPPGGGNDRYDPHDAACCAWNAIRIRVSADPPKFRPAPASARVAALMAAWFVPLRWRDTVYVVPRDSHDPAEVPGGGVLLNVESGFIRQRVSARFARMTDGKEVPSKGAVTDGITAFCGGAHTLAAAPYTRWGRGVDGAIWWDSGGREFVRIAAHGWSVETEPGAYFVRPTGMPVLPLPEHGGAMGRLWDFARVDVPDRDLVLAWMLQQADPDYESACPLLYLTGQHGAAKSTAATVIAMACGDEPERDIPKDPGADAHDFMVSLSGTHITLLDNLSHVSAQASDVLCVAVTGGTSRQRKLFTDIDLVYLRLRKPLIATSIDLGIVREDLAERMIPIRLPLAPTGTERKSEKRLMADFRDARPGIFGALLDIMVGVLAAEQPAAPLPRLAAFGETAARLDAVTGSRSLARLDELLAELAQRAVGEDVFWAAVYDALGQSRWSGTCGELLGLVDPDGDLARQHRRGGWPSNARALSQRMERIAPTLRAVGWAVARNAPSGTKRALTWTICPRPGHEGCPAGCEQSHDYEPQRPRLDADF
jgi:hypothetical protein